MEIAVRQIKKLRVLENVSDTTRIGEGAAMVEDSGSGIEPLVVGRGRGVADEVIGVNEAIGEAAALDKDACTMADLIAAPGSVFGHRAVDQGPAPHIDTPAESSIRRLSRGEIGVIGYDQRITDDAVDLENSRATDPGLPSVGGVAEDDAPVHLAAFQVSARSLADARIAGDGATHNGA